MNRELLRKLPKVDELLKDQEIDALIEKSSYNIVIKSIRTYLDEIRDRILSEEDVPAELVDFCAIRDKIKEMVEKKEEASLRHVINCTGIPLHTNLGRAPLCNDAIKMINQVASAYSNLEFDLETGKRGLRHDHIEKLISELTGAEAAMVVNNNAAATMLVLAALCRGKEVITSRGELVEIGGSFRIPEIMEESGAFLAEVGTTNKVRAKDYENRITEETAALLKVHPSNYRILGFTEEATIPELKAIGEKYNLPVIYDMGCGLMVDLKPYGIDEPAVKESLDMGADVILFSGDKLFGGPQCGIIAGRKELIGKMKSHPLARAFRVDKMTLAGLEATCRKYFDEEKAKAEIPVLRALTVDENILKEMAENLVENLNKISTNINAELIETENQVGGGSAPLAILKGWGVRLTHSELTAEQIWEGLRAFEIPVITYIEKDQVIFDMRSLLNGDEEVIIKAVKEILD